MRVSVYVCVCVCVCVRGRVCVGACAWARVRGRVCVGACVYIHRIIQYLFVKYVLTHYFNEEWLEII